MRKLVQREFKRDMYGNYLVIEQNKTVNTDYELKMLLNNQPDGILPLELRQMDNKKYYYFNITSRQDLLHILEKECIGAKEVKAIIQSILEAVERGNEFLLSGDNYVVDPEYLFAEAGSFTVSLCYIPGYHRPVREQLARFLEYLMDHINYREEGAVRLTYGLYQLSRREDCTFAALGRRMEEEPEIQEKSMDYAEERMPEEHHGFFPEKIESEEEVLRYSKRTWLLCSLTVFLTLLVLWICLRTGILANGKGEFSPQKGGLALFMAFLADGCFILLLLRKENREPFIHTKVEYKEPDIGPPQDRTIIYEKEWAEPTTVLYEEGMGDRYLLRALDAGQYQDIPLTDFPFFVGKLKKNVDCFIENSTISRFHAKLEKEDGVFYLSDLNSTNGTSRNHIRLNPNERIRIEPGDIISFADVSYRLVKE